MASGKLSYSFVVARSRNFVIGCENRLPWNLPTDLKNFRRLTVGKVVLMGRRTYESIGRPLPHRINIVVSRENGIHDPGVIVVPDKEAAMEAAKTAAAACGSNEIMVIGGAEIFELFKDEVGKVYLTEVDAVIQGGDAYYRRDFSDWKPVGMQTFSPTEGGDEYGFTVTVLEKRSSRSILSVLVAAE